MLVCGIVVVLNITGVMNNNQEITLSIENENIIAHKSQTINLFEVCNIKVLPENVKYSPSFTSENTIVATVGAVSGIVHCKQVGNVKLFVKLNTGKEIISKEINLNVLEELIYPTNVAITHDEIQMTINDTNTNALVITGETNIEPTITYSNNLVSFDYLTGTITSYGQTGQCDVTIKMPKNENNEYFTLTFTVTITNQMHENQNDTITINQTKAYYYDYEGYSLSNTEIVPQMSENGIVEILDYDYGYVLVKGLSVGTVVITISSSEYVFQLVLNVTE